ncbi:MAG: peptide/nickel transport system permease protein [Solirubrobacteraceae bacterium]
MATAVPRGDLVVDVAPQAQVGGSVWRRLLRRPGGVIAVAVLLLLVGSAVFAPLFVPSSPTEIGVGAPLQGPSAAHLFGTDELGRDLFSRTMYGGRLALRITVVATLIALVAGTAWGACAAIARGWVDDVLMRIVDAALAVPFLLLALILVAAFGASPWSLSLVLGIVSTPITARVVRAGVLSELHLEYLLAARAYGASTRRLLWSEVLPNVVPTLLVQASVIASTVLLTEAALSFVGLGVQPPEASWGTLILQGYSNINVAPTQIVFPGAMMFVAVWAINALAEQLQAVLDANDRAQIGAHA